MNLKNASKRRWTFISEVFINKSDTAFVSPELNYDNVVKGRLIIHEHIPGIYHSHWKLEKEQIQSIDRETTVEHDPCVQKQHASTGRTKISISELLNKV